MTDQTFITDDGQIGSQPLTWDGQPLYSPETVKEGLFDASAFEQQPGQLAIYWAPCSHCDGNGCRSCKGSGEELVSEPIGSDR